MKNILLAILTAVLFIAMPFVLIYMNRVYCFTKGERTLIIPFAIIFFIILIKAVKYFFKQALKQQIK